MAHGLRLAVEPCATRDNIQDMLLPLASRDLASVWETKSQGDGLAWALGGRAGIPETSHIQSKCDFQARMQVKMFLVQCIHFNTVSNIPIGAWLALLRTATVAESWGRGKGRGQLCSFPSLKRSPVPGVKCSSTLPSTPTPPTRVENLLSQHCSGPQRFSGEHRSPCPCGA